MSRCLTFEVQNVEVPFQERKNPEENTNAGTQNLEKFANNLEITSSGSLEWKNAK